MSDQPETPEVDRNPVEDPAEAPKSKGILPGWARVVLGVVVVIGALFLLRRWIPLQRYLRQLLKWTEEAGPVGAVVLGVVYVVGALVLFPGSVLTMGAGFLYGLFWGTVTVSIASTTAALCAFLIGRTVGRDWVAERIRGNKKFSAVDEAVGRQGFKIVFLIRLSPVFPYTLQNYAFGLTDIAFWKYALATWIGMIPGTVMYVYFGKAANDIAEIMAGEATLSGAQKIFSAVGLLVTVGVVVFVTKVAKNAITNAVAETDAADAEVLEEE